jgi:hypothetical protein
MATQLIFGQDSLTIRDVRNFKGGTNYDRVILKPAFTDYVIDWGNETIDLGNRSYSGDPILSYTVEKFPDYATFGDFIDAIVGWVGAGGTTSKVTYFPLTTAIQVVVPIAATPLESLIITAEPALTSEDLANISWMEFDPEGDVRYAFFTDPTNLIGMRLSDTRARLIDGNPADINFISATGSTVKMNIQIGTK